MKHKTIILTHLYTSVEFTCARIKRRGYKILQIKTAFDTVWIKKSWHDICTYCDFIFESKNDFEQDLLELKQIIQSEQLEIVAVLNCMDPSLFYSDSLSNALNELNLNLEFSQIRTNKFKVNEQLHLAGVPAIKSVFVATMDAWETQYQAISQLNLPLIVKPVNSSAARNDVKIIHDINQLENIITTIINHESYFGMSKQQVLIQEYIEGKEYYVNSVSWQGQHFVAGIFKYHKLDKVLKATEILDTDDLSQVDTLVQYNLQCLNALQVHHGLTHNEIILTPAGKPYLIEMNNRLSGSDSPLFSMDCYGVNEIDIFLDLLENKPITEFSRQTYRYGIKLRFANFYVDNPTCLDLSGISSDTRIIAFRPEKIDRTKPLQEDLYFKDSAIVYLSHFSKLRLDEDVALLLKREEEGILFT